MIWYSPVFSSARSGLVTVCRIVIALPTGRGRQARLVDVVAVLRAEPELVLNVVRAIRACPDRREEVAGRSYWHSNGFAKIKLVEREDFGLRLHIWPAGPDRRGDMDPHGHRWEFASWLLTGQGLVEKYFTETGRRDPEAAEYVHCRYGHTKRARSLSRPRIAHLRAVDQFEHEVGGIYGCTTDVVHTIDPIGTDFMATVVLQGRAVRRSTPVYLRTTLTDDDRYVPFSDQELHDLLGDLEIAMGGLPPQPPLSSAAERRTVGRWHPEIPRPEEACGQQSTAFDRVEPVRCLS